MADSNGEWKAESQAPKAKTDQNKGDMISELPDDILIRILSRLTVEEATVTSILSTRWRHLCTYITHLHFQPLKLPNPIIHSTPPKQENNFDVSSNVWHPPRFVGRRMKTPPKEFSTSTSVDWINHVLDCYNGGHALKEFRLNMPSATQLDVEKWLAFAFSREVETLYIHLHTESELLRSELVQKFIVNIDGDSTRSRFNNRFNFLTEYYSYPLRNLILKHKDNGCPCFTSLKTLYLHNVDLHVLEVELMLSNCVVLETLCITYSPLLGNVIKIGGSSLKLKHLEISHCCPTIHIHDLINLVSFSFTYFGSQTVWSMDQKSVPIVVENVPSLIEIDWIHKSDVTLMSTGLSCCLHQLVKLTLGLIKPLRMQNCVWHPSLPKLMNLKYLVFTVDMIRQSRLLKLTTLIEACPILEKLDVQFSWWTPKEFHDTDNPIEEELWEHPHNNLKQVRFCNYLGSTSELEFGLCIVKNAVNLEEFVVEPCATINYPSRIDEISIRRKASALAHQHFQATVPKSVKLVIL